MYQDSSRNPITAREGVDVLLGALQAGLAGGVFRPVPRYHYNTSVGLEAYEHLLALYDEVAGAAELHIRKLKLQSARQAAEIARLKWELTRRN